MSDSSFGLDPRISSNLMVNDRKQQAGRQYDDVMQRSFCFILLASSSIFRSTGCKALGMKIAQTLGVLLSILGGARSFQFCFLLHVRPWTAETLPPLPPPLAAGTLSY